MLAKYENEKFTDFSLPENRAAMEQALSSVAGQLGRHYPLIIGGQSVDTKERITSLNPSRHREVVGTVAQADSALAEKAIQAAQTAFGEWSKVDPAVRARYLFKLAAVLRRRKFEFSAWLVQEVGKTWAEADGDTAEAIDFIEYYGRQMLRLAEGMPLASLAGEQNECTYIPLGVGVVIAPWNFPLAILTGMTIAAVVAGNTVVVKPASATPVIAAKLMELLEEVSLPPGVVNYLPGSGGAVGDFLVSHPKVRFINFTGSKAVGIRIYRLAAEVGPGQKWLKRVAAEMGGKDAIIVDSSADIEAAVAGSVRSAFGFQGQKCSACSRLIVVKDVYDTVVAKVAEKARELKLGAADDPGVAVGPVIDAGAFRKITEYIAVGKAEGRLVAGGQANDQDGYFIEPTVFADVAADARIAQEEIFGPVLAIIKAKDFSDALRIANGTDYGLTGAVFSNNRANLELARRDFHVGNLYFNQKCTGALVGAQPFGGFNLSGTDSKAGGADYLLQFLQAKAVSEKL